MTHVDELKSSGLKATLPRIKILEIFQHAQRRQALPALQQANVVHGDLGLFRELRLRPLAGLAEPPNRSPHALREPFFVGRHAGEPSTGGSTIATD